MASFEKLAQVLPGHRVEVLVPELAEGMFVNVVVQPCGEPAAKGQSISAFLDSLPEGPRAFATWEEYEQHLCRERDAWDR